MPRPLLVLPAVLLAGVLTACGTADDADPGRSATAAGSTSGSASTSAPGVTPSGSPATAAGRYVDLSDYESDPASFDGSTVVLFFAAPWCPTCRETDENLLADGVPAGLTVVKTDYDTETDLRQKYGVTVQHTFVQVDEMGTQLAKFSGSTTGEDILANTV